MTARRNFLAFTAGAMAAKTVLPLAARAKTQPNQYSASENGSPDGALIHVCGEYLRIQREFEAAYNAQAGEDGLDRQHSVWLLLAPKDELVERIIALRATTPEGHYARARCLAFETLPGSQECRDNPGAAEQDRFYAALLRDLVHLERRKQS